MTLYSGAGNGHPNPQEIERDIERTRSEMSRTLEQIREQLVHQFQDQLSPEQVARQIDGRMSHYADTLSQQLMERAERYLDRMLAEVAERLSREADRRAERYAELIARKMAEQARQYMDEVSERTYARFHRYAEEAQHTMGRAMLNPLPQLLLIGLGAYWLSHNLRHAGTEDPLSAGSWERAPEPATEQYPSYLD